MSNERSVSDSRRMNPRGTHVVKDDLVIACYDIYVQSYGVRLGEGGKRKRTGQTFVEVGRRALLTAVASV